MPCPSRHRVSKPLMGSVEEASSNHTRPVLIAGKLRSTDDTSIDLLARTSNFHNGFLVNFVSPLAMTPIPTRPLKCPSPQRYSLGRPSSASPEVGTRVSSADPLPTRNLLQPRWALPAWGRVGVTGDPVLWP